MDNKTVYQSMRAYQNAHKVYSDLRKQHDLLVEQQRDLLPEVAKAEAEANKAREMMLTTIQANAALKQQ